MLNLTIIRNSLSAQAASPAEAITFSWAASHAEGRADNINQRENLALTEVPYGNQKIILQHIIPASYMISFSFPSRRVPIRQLIRNQPCEPHTQTNTDRFRYASCPFPIQMIRFPR
jgi:hypothetical protein